MMKYYFALALALSSTISTAFARDTYVQGYVRSNGTYVQGHYRSAPDNTVNNNYTTQGNMNPYTGSVGTRPRELKSYDGYNSGNTFGNSNSGSGLNKRHFGSDDE